jgi:ABC-type dipeptide/oligopeptide/nickel transport system permease component
LDPTGLSVTITRRYVWTASTRLRERPRLPVVQAVVFLIAAGYLLINLAIDILYANLDRHIRLS